MNGPLAGASSGRTPALRLEGPLERERLRDLAAVLHALMLDAYRVEAGVLGVADFFPLRRTLASLLESPTRFHAAWRGEQLVGAAEVDTDTAETPNLDALVVHPDHFRRGIGRALVAHVLQAHRATAFTVSTGERNTPAIALYESAGFAVVLHWRTDDGIAMVTLRKGLSSF